MSGDAPSWDHGHDFSDPVGRLNMLEAALLATQMPKCRHCDAKRTTLTMSGGGFGVMTTHELGCPEHEDFPS